MKSGNPLKASSNQKTLRLIANCWLVAVLVAFAVIRVLGSQTFVHVFAR